MSLSQRRTKIIGRLRSRKTRVREGAVLVEGVRAVKEALSAGAKVHFLVHAPRLDAMEGGAALRLQAEAAGADLHDVSDGELDELSDTEHGQGVLAVCAEPHRGGPVVRPGGRYLVLDAIQDPGNAGTLVRAARAFALDGVLALDGTVDLWSPKAVRASAGMAFQIPLQSLKVDEARELLQDARVPLLVADAGGKDIATVTGQGAWALVVGNEGAGPRPGVADAAELTVRVPMPGGGESLNAGVAGAILLYALSTSSPPKDT